MLRNLFVLFLLVSNLIQIKIVNVHTYKKELTFKGKVDHGISRTTFILKNSRLTFNIILK